MTSSNPKTARALFPHVIIPAWLALGATFKMLESDARLLPKSVLQTLGSLGLTEGNLLSYSLAGMVGIEFLMAGLMFARSAFARPAAAAILGLFCLILGVELVDEFHKNIWGSVGACVSSSSGLTSLHCWWAWTTG